MSTTHHLKAMGGAYYKRKDLFMNIGNNIGNIMKIAGAWNAFKSNHPKFPAFCQAVSRKGLKEGSIIEIAITTPEGEKIVKDSDLELLKQLSELKM